MCMCVFFISTVEETGIGDPAGLTDCSQCVLLVFARRYRLEAAEFLSVTFRSAYSLDSMRNVTNCVCVVKGGVAVGKVPVSL